MKHRTVRAAAVLAAGMILSGLCTAAGRFEDEFAAAVVNVVTEGALKADGSADAGKGLNRLAGQAGEGATFYFPKGTYLIESAVVIPENCELLFDEGAVLKIASGATVHIKGTLQAGDSQIFSGDGKLLFSGKGVGNPRWFGAKGDGTADDSAAFRKALEAFDEVEVPAAAGYRVGGLVLTRNKVLRGREGKAVLKGVGSGPVLTVKGSEVRVQNLTFRMESAPESVCIYFDTSGGAVDRCLFENIEAHNAATVVKDSGQNMVITTSFDSFRCINGTGTAFDMNNMWGFIFLRDTVIDYSGASKAMDYPAVSVRSNAGLILRNVSVIGNAKATARSAGFVTQNSEAVWFENCSVKNVGGDGFRHTGSPNQHLYFLNCRAESVGQNGFRADNGRYLQYTDCVAKNVGQNGMHIAGGSYLQVDGGEFSGAANGISATSPRSIFTNVKVSNNKLYGLSAAAADCVAAGVTGTGNGSGLLSVTGSGSGTAQ